MPNACFVYMLPLVLFSTEVSMVCVHVCIFSFSFFFFLVSFTRPVKRHGDSNYYIIKYSTLYREASQLL